MKQVLPNGCHTGKISVSPKNWKSSKASIKKDWYISYRFHDPSKGIKHRLFAGMNEFKTLQERQSVTDWILKNEIRLLQQGYNPFSDELVTELQNQPGLNQYTPFLAALQFVYDSMAKSNAKAKSTRVNIKSMLKMIAGPADNTGIRFLSISEIGVRHFKALLDNCANTIPGFSNDRHNKFRTYLMILYSELLEYEVVKSCVPRDIKKKKVIKKIRLTLTDEERVLINNHLKKKVYTFWRLMHIFFHSGCRETEIMKVKVSDVDMINQRFKVTVLKGRSYQEEWRVIKDIVKPLWDELLLNAQPTDFLFAKGLKPGPVAINSNQLTKRWYTHVKADKKNGGLGIKADLYSLKHSHTTELVELLSEEAAARMNGHKSTAMVVGIYDVKNRQRKQEALKSVDNPFVKTAQ